MVNTINFAKLQKNFEIAFREEELADSSIANQIMDSLTCDDNMSALENYPMNLVLSVFKKFKNEISDYSGFRAGMIIHEIKHLEGVKGRQRLL